MSTYLAPIGSGLGDAIIALPVLQWLIKHSPKSVFLVARSQRQLGLTERIAGLAGTVREPDLPNLIAADDRFINLRDHPLQRHWDWRSRKFRNRFPNYLIDDIQATICADHDIFPDFKHLQPLLYKPCPQTSGAILLVPGTTTMDKSWPLAHWSALYAQIKKLSLPCYMLGEPDRSKTVAQLIPEIPHIKTVDVGSAVDAISAARLVVSVDTGLMHIAVQQNVQTVAIFGDQQIYLRPHTHCHSLIVAATSQLSQPELMENHEFSTTYEWGWLPRNAEPNQTYKQQQLQQQEQNISQITPQQVMRLVNSSLDLPLSVSCNAV